MKDFISILLRRQKAAKNISEPLINPEKCFTAEELVRQLLAALSFPELALDTADNFQEHVLPEAVCTYLASLHKSIDYISSREANKGISCNKQDVEETKMDVKNHTLIAHSPYSSLIYPDKKKDEKKPGKKPQSKSQLSEEPITACEEQNDSDIFPLNVHYRNYVTLYPSKSLKYIAYALSKNIKMCPYSSFIRLPAYNKKSDGTPDERKKNKLPHDFENYVDSSGEPIINLADKPEELPTNLKILNDDVLKLFFMLGGPWVIEYFRHMEDITYKNDNIKSPRKIKKFFRDMYNDVITKTKPLESDCNTHYELLFNYFALEAILNGSFLFYFCDSFSDNGRLITKLKKIYPEQEYLGFLSDLYEQINRIENPFLKCGLLDEIQSFIRSYECKKVDRCNNHLIAGTQPKEETEFFVWKNKIFEYCQYLVTMEQKVYKNYVSLISPAMQEPDTKMLIDAYSSLFTKSGICSNSNKRTEHYKELLLKITLSNYKYYPLWHKKMWKK